MIRTRKIGDIRHGDPVNVRRMDGEYVTRGKFHVDDDGNESVRTGLGMVIELNQEAALEVWPTKDKRFRKDEKIEARVVSCPFCPFCLLGHRLTHSRDRENPNR